MTSRAIAVPIQTVLLATATYVAASRVLDGRHHLTDVLAGSLVGFGIANLAYWRRFHLDGTLRSQDESDVEISVAPMMIQFSLRY